MENKKTKLSKGLKRLFAATVIVAVLYVIALILFAIFAKSTGDAELGSFMGVVRYHLKGVLLLATFQYGNNILYFAISVFLYALTICWVIFLVAGILINDKKNTNVMTYAIVSSFISLLLYIGLASGSRKYWQIINGNLGNLYHFALTIIMISLTALYFLLSIIFYFWCVFRAFLAFSKRNLYEEEPEEEFTSNSGYIDDSRIRQIVREELLNCQPFKVVIVGNEQPKVEEEPIEEVDEVIEEKEAVKEEVALVKEEAKPALVPTVKFWDIARDVWPQLDNPKPLKVDSKEESPKQTVVAKKEIINLTKVSFWDIARQVWPQLDNPKPLPREEKQVEVPNNEEQEEGWNRNKRQPFLVRIITAELDTKVNYNEIKNELLSYGVKSRISRGGDTFRLGGKEYAKIYLVGKTLKVYFALSPEDYKDSTYPIEDVGHRPNYAEMPLLFKVRSPLSVRRCKELIKAACEKDGLVQKEVKDTNWVDELRKLNASKAKKQ